MMTLLPMKQLPPTNALAGLTAMPATANPKAITRFGTRVEAIKHKGCGLLLVIKQTGEYAYVCHRSVITCITLEDTKVLD